MNQSMMIRSSAVLWLEVFVLALGGGLLLISSDRHIYLGGLIAFACVGVMGLLRCTFNARSITIWDIFLMSLCLGYGLGTLNTELNWIHDASEYLTVTRAAPIYVIRATAWLMLMGALMAALSSLDPHMVLQNVEFRPEQRPAILLFIFGVIAAAIVQMATGTIGFHQDMTDGGVQVSALAALTVSAICPAIALGSFSWPQWVGWPKRWMLAGIGMLLLIQFYQGRRVFIYSMILALICQFAANRNKRTFTSTNIMGLLVAGMLIFGASKAFFALRMAMWELGSARDTVALISKGFDILQSAERSGLSQEVELNQQSRTFIVGYLAELIEAQESIVPMHGDVLGFDLAVSVPSVIWPEKYKVLAYGAEEGVANPHFGLPIDDEANSLETTGASDFGITGIFVYPVALCLLYGFVLRQSRKLGSVGYVLILAALVNNLLNVEIGTAEFVGTLRSLLIALIAAWCVRLVWRTLTSTAPVESFEPVRKILVRLRQVSLPFLLGLLARCRLRFSARSGVTRA